MLTQSALLLSVIASAVAFQPAFRPSFVPSQVTARSLFTSDQETSQMLSSVNEASKTEVDSLVAELKEQEMLLSEQLSAVSESVSELQKLNEKKVRKTDDIRALIKDMMRVFDSSKANHYATGYSGDIGKKMTAYDVLAPKKWSQSAAELKELNEMKGKQAGEVRDFVKDSMRVFDSSKSSHYATGYSGEIGKKMTAYDVLAPKKWSQSAVEMTELNEKKVKQSGEVRSFVKDSMRVFDSNKSTHSASGYSGEVGNGPMTAYDVLAPKKWSARN